MGALQSAVRNASVFLYCELPYLSPTEAGQTRHGLKNRRLRRQGEGKNRVPHGGCDCCRNDCRELLALGSHRRKRRPICLLLVEFLDFRGPRKLGFASLAACFSGRMPAKRDVAVLSITGVDVVLSTVPSFAHHVVGTDSRQGNTGRPRREAALLESKLGGTW